MTRHFFLCRDPHDPQGLRFLHRRYCERQTGGARDGICSITSAEISSAEQAGKLAVEICQEAFADQHWNCSTLNWTGFLLKGKNGFLSGCSIFLMPCFSLWSFQIVVFARRR